MNKVLTLSLINYLWSILLHIFVISGTRN